MKTLNEQIEAEAEQLAREYSDIPSDAEEVKYYFLEGCTFLMDNLRLIPAHELKKIEAVRELIEAATRAIKEAIGTIHTHEDVIRQDHGNTNIQVVEIKYGLFKDAIKAFEEKAE